MKIYITAQNKYGNDLLYPACETSKIFAELTRKKTLDISDLMKIKKLGYEVEITGHIDPAMILALV